jgi:hypothetical protein
MKWWIICSVTSKSEITPSCSGRIATMCDGVRPTISLASLPTAFTLLRRRDEMSMATTDGSLMTIPRFLTWTSVLAVPRSIPISSENSPKSQSTGLFTRNLSPQCAGHFNALAGAIIAFPGTYSRKITLEYTTRRQPPKKTLQSRGDLLPTRRRRAV